jgi:hypothetical protein
VVVSAWRENGTPVVAMVIPDEKLLKAPDTPAGLKSIGEKVSAGAFKGAPIEMHANDGSNVPQVTVKCDGKAAAKAEKSDSDDE